jgi:murein L,D-transpeptidase YcbB/YkuD
MRRTSFCIAVLLIVLAACRSNNNRSHQGQTRLVPRNHAINSSNAYNSLFIDSQAVEQYIRKQQTDEEMAYRIRNFYNRRNYEFAWMDKDGLTEQALGFHSLYHFQRDTGKLNKSLETRIDDLMSEDSPRVAAHDPGMIKTELQLTEKFLRYGEAQAQQWPDSAELWLPAQKMTARQLAGTFLTDNKTETDNAGFKGLTKALKQYLEIASKGGWPVVPEGKYKKGMHSPAIALLRKRLQVTGELEAKDTASAVFDDALEAAVKNFQAHHGHTADGLVTPSLVKEMNVPVQNRIQQLLVNLQRVRWMPAAVPGKLILVNIPEFMLHVWEDDRKAFDMPVIVGKEGHNTTMFYGDLNEIVFSPYWNLPPGIIRREVLPAMEKNKNYLEENQMEITGERNGLPVIRQLPGEKNALGKVKFLFPNSFNIYFHDTPAKDLFNRDKRAYSHGCIRLSDPVKLAQYLLQDRPGWDSAHIDSAMNAGKEKYVELKQKVPVIITYLTAWVDETGALQLREDIYGHDDKLAAKLLLDPVLHRTEDSTELAKE